MSIEDQQASVLLLSLGLVNGFCEVLEACSPIVQSLVECLVLVGDIGLIANNGRGRTGARTMAHTMRTHAS